jgi:hypothetical protein
LVHGCGVVGTRAARQLLSVGGVDELILSDPRTDHVAAVVRSLGGPARELGTDSWWAVDADVVLLAGPPNHVADARRALESGAHVVSTGDALDDVEGLLGLDGLARTRGRHLIVGAGFSPGLTCVLAKHASAELATVDEIHVAKLGTAGPECARQHHRALQTSGRDWRDGAWADVRGGSGRELCWFPDPIAGSDCYRAALPEPLLLHELFPSAQRITARMSATRRDRLTARLPMMRKPHAEAGAGAIRVEVRGTFESMSEVIVFGCMDRPSVGAATVSAVAVGEVLAERVGPPGARGLGGHVEPVTFLAELARRGVKCARFDGSPSHAR